MNNYVNDTENQDFQHRGKDILMFKVSEVGLKTY